MVPTTQQEEQYGNHSGGEEVATAALAQDRDPDGQELLQAQEGPQRAEVGHGLRRSQVIPLFPLSPSPIFLFLSLYIRFGQKQL